jgi:hypothetical protein
LVASSLVALTLLLASNPWVGVISPQQAVSADAIPTIAPTISFEDEEPPSEPLPPAGDEGETEEPHEPPVIVEFASEDLGGGSWLVSGRVESCDELEGVEVMFGDLGDGEMATTGIDGSFGTFLYLEPEISGTVSAVAWCNAGLESNMAIAYIDGGEW